MEVSIGLPNAAPGVEGKRLVEFGRAAEEAGFQTLGTLDRVVYHSYEPLVTLSAIAAVTERIRLMTAVLLAPLRSTPILAKQAAALDNISGGRLVLGMALGAREDDYELTDIEIGRKGDRFDRQLAEMRALWDGESRGHAGAVGPAPVERGGPTVVVGGSADAAFRRAAKYGAGWIMGGGTPDAFKEAMPKLDEAWQAEGRDGQPRRMALAYYGLGPNAERAVANVRDYYDWLGDYAEQIAGSVATDADTVRGYAAAFEEAGCDELIMFAAVDDPDQVSLLREAVG